MDQLSYKSIPAFTLAATPDDAQADPRVVKQIFSVMGAPDDVFDIIKNGAYRKTLKERPDRIRVLWQHDFHEPPVGVPLKLKEIGKDDLPEELLAKYPEATGALYGEIKYLDTPRGNEVLQGIVNGAIRENSIGFDPVKWRMEGDVKSGEPLFRIIDEIRLWDVSPVNWGAHPATQNIKGALPFKATPKADEGEAWDAGVELKKADGAEALRAMHAWVDSEGDPDVKGSYKLPHHKGDGGHAVVWKGVAAAMGRLMQANTDIPEGDRKGVYNHLAKHYAQFDKEVPDFKFIELGDSVRLMQGLSDQTLAALLAELKEGRVLSSANLERLKAALKTLEDILFSAEPPDKGDGKESVEQSSALARAQSMALTANVRVRIAERELLAAQGHTFDMKVR